MEKTLAEIQEKWLRQCGPCDAGIPSNCNCPEEDPRPVILDLTREVELLSHRLDGAQLRLKAAESIQAAQAARIVTLENQIKDQEGYGDK